MIQNKLFHEQLAKVSPKIKKEIEWSAMIIDNIDRILKEKQMSHRELASKIGCNETQLVRWTRGFPNYTLSTLAKLSTALGEDLITIGQPHKKPVSGYQGIGDYQRAYLSEGSDTKDIALNYSKSKKAKAHNSER